MINKLKQFSEKLLNKYTWHLYTIINIVCLLNSRLLSINNCCKFYIIFGELKINPKILQTIMKLKLVYITSSNCLIKFNILL